jgi:hypothetical protein
MWKSLKGNGCGELNVCSQETTEHRSQDSPSTIFERMTSRLRSGANHSTATSIRYKFSNLIIGGRRFRYQVNIFSLIPAMLSYLNRYNIISGASKTFHL